MISEGGDNEREFWVDPTIGAAGLELELSVAKDAAFVLVDEGKGVKQVGFDCKILPFGRIWIDC